MFVEDDVFVIAEIGGNHEGRHDEAVRLVNLACEAAVHAVKLQIYSAEGLVSRVESPDRHQHFKKFSLETDDYLELAQIVTKRGVLFMASLWDRRAVKVFDPLIAVHKIGSGDLNAYELIEAIVETGKPIIMSCGLADLDQILQTVGFIQSIDPTYVSARKLCLLQCGAMYPLPSSEAHLNAMGYIRDKTGLPVGYSDHTIGTEACEIAVAMGACVIEKHFTDSRENKTFRDHQVSLTRDEFREMVDTFGRIKRLQGEYGKSVTLSETEAGHMTSFRRAVYPAIDLPSGAVLTRENVVSLRPNVGIDGRSYFKVLGRRLKVAKSAHQRLAWEDLE